jgi:hypothetical protein
MTGSDLIRKYRICEATFLAWIRHGMPVFKRKITLRKSIFDKRVITQWIIENKTKPHCSRQRYAVMCGVKRCSVCGKIKPLTKFSLDTQKAGKKSNRCSACDRKRCRYWTEKNRERNALRHREYALKNIEYFRKLDKKQKASPKGQARKKLRNAVRRGEVKKPEYCSICERKLPRKKISGHHKDYSKPLDVIWVCHICHGKHHRKV